MSDPGVTYRTRDEVEMIKSSRDCIENVKRIILDNSVATEQELKEIEKKIRADIEKDIEKIKTDPFPSSNELYTHIYVDNEPHFIRGVEYEQSITEPKH